MLIFQFEFCVLCFIGFADIDVHTHTVGNVQKSYQLAWPPTSAAMSVGGSCWSSTGMFMQLFCWWTTVRDFESPLSAHARSVTCGRVCVCCRCTCALHFGWHAASRARCLVIGGTPAMCGLPGCSHYAQKWHHTACETLVQWAGHWAAFWGYRTADADTLPM